MHPTVDNYPRANDYIIADRDRTTGSNVRVAIDEDVISQLDSIWIAKDASRKNVGFPFTRH